jgi:hydroxyacylglutathione hydrolase
MPVAAQVVGPRADADRIPGIDIQVGDGDTWKFGSLDMKVFDTPGHTRGHISLWFPQAEALFCGGSPILTGSVQGVQLEGRGDRTHCIMLC